MRHRRMRLEGKQRGFRGGLKQVMSYTLRQGDLADIEAIYRLNRESFSEYWSRESLFSALESGYGLLLCEDNGKPVGYLLSLTVLDEIQIMQIAVSLDYRRQGIARRMTEALTATTTHPSVFTLEVRLSNQAAIRFYATLGFKEVGRRKNYYAPNASGCREDAALMNKYIR